MSDKDCDNCLNKSQKKAFGEDKIIGMPYKILMEAKTALDKINYSKD